MSVLMDMIEIEDRVVRHMRRFELPLGVASVLFAVAMLVADIGATRWVIILLIFFSVIFAKNMLRHRHRTGRLAELEEQLAQLQDDWSRLTDGDKRLRGPS